MKILYLDCSMGAAGDMLTAALIELLPDANEFISEVNSIGLHGVAIKKEISSKCGINGAHISVTIHGEEESHNMHEHHHHNGLHDIEHIISHLKVSDRIKENALGVYGLIAEAEGQAHGVPVKEIHFHEVGTLDAIADIVSVCMLMERLSPDKVISSPVHVGYGHIKAAHGILPVPAPATAHILRTVPIYGGKIKGELCTPTGAALLKYFTDDFGAMPVMKTEKIGYGMGKKDFEVANCVRAFYGETESKNNTITELSCNLDDMTPEYIGFAMEKLLEGNALDVYTVPIGMKKNRPATMLCVLCENEKRDDMIRLIFKHTSTLGIRESTLHRHTLSRKEETVNTKFGEVHKKISDGYGVIKEKLEYDDLKKIADENGFSLEEVKEFTVLNSNS